MPYITLPGLPQVIAYNPTEEDANFHGLLERLGAEILHVREIAVGTLMGGFGEELHYVHDGKERYAYVVPHRLEIDAFAEESLICSAPLPNDHNAIADAFLAARQQPPTEPAP